MVLKTVNINMKGGLMPRTSKLKYPALKAIILLRMEREGKKTPSESETEDMPPETLAYLTDRLAGLLAKRLLRGEGNGEIFTDKDNLEFAKIIVEKFHEEHPELSPKEAEDGTQMLRSLYSGMIRHLSPTRNAYQDYWEWLGLVSKLARERGVAEVALLQEEEAWDEITRRKFTKAEYMAHCQKTLELKCNPEGIRQALFAGFEKHLDEAGPEERKEIEADFEKEMMPGIRAGCAEQIKVSLAFHKKEARRIFGKKKK
jgi:hypothetical protein